MWTGSSRCVKRPSAIPAPISIAMRRLSDAETRNTADRIWSTINLRNLRENVLPTRQRADLILRKEADHVIHSVALRKL